MYAYICALVLPADIWAPLVSSAALPVPFQVGDKLTFKTLLCYWYMYSVVEREEEEGGNLPKKKIKKKIKKKDQEKRSS